MEVKGSMDEKKFDELMDRWAALEMESAPEITPVPEVYAKLGKNRRKGTRRVPWAVRLAAVGLAGAAVVLLIVIRRPGGVATSPGLRQGYLGEGRGSFAALPEPQQAEKESHKPAVAAPAAGRTAKLERLDEDLKGQKSGKKSVTEIAVFQFYNVGTGGLKEIDIDAAGEEMTVLSSEDNYRLTLELSAERYVYLFQTGPGRMFARLFPNQEYSAGKNPLPPGRTHVFPDPPDWFFTDPGGGEVTITIVTSVGPEQDWDDIPGRSKGPKRSRAKDRLSENQVDAFRRLRGSPEKDASVSEFTFRVR